MIQKIIKCQIVIFLIRQYSNKSNRYPFTTKRCQTFYLSGTTPRCYHMTDKSQEQYHLKGCIAAVNYSKQSANEVIVIQGSSFSHITFKNDKNVI